MKNIIKSLIIFVLLSLFTTLNILKAQAPLTVIMSEINFDPIGNDDKKEWIKLTNLSSGPINVSNYSIAWGLEVYGCKGYYQIPVGTIMDGYGSLIIGGPISNQDNGYPCIDLPVDFDENLPNDAGPGTGTAVGIALYNRGPESLGGICNNYYLNSDGPPIHSFVYNGIVNNGTLYDRNGNIKDVDIVDVGAEGNEAIFFLFGQSWAIESNIGPQGTCSCDWYKDIDGDLIGGEYISSSCKRPGYCINNSCSNVGGDCDDNNFVLTGYQTYYYDQDGDGHYGGNGQVYCGMPFCGFTSCAPYKDDCDDTDPSIFFNCPGQNQCAHPDFNALIEMYYSLNGPAWINKFGWVDGASGSDCDPCDSWYGVSCVNNRVIGLSLSANNLNGQMPSTLDELSELTWLFLNNNNLSGYIPSAIGQLTKIENIRLHDNALSGILPKSIGELPNIQNVNLSE